MNLVFLDNVCVTLTDNLSSTDTVMPISTADKSKLTDLLGEDGYSYLTFNSSSGTTEEVKIYTDSGEITMERGDSPLSLPSGKCTCFKVTKSVLDDYLTNPPELCEVTIESGSEDFIEVTPPDEGNCNWVISLKQDFIDKLNDCCPEDDCNNCTVTDGTYENATITVINGRVCSISNGKNIVYTGGSTCCNCENCE